LDKRVAGIVIPAPLPVNLEPLKASVVAVDQRVAALRFPAPPAVPDHAPELAALAAKLQALDDRVAAIVIPTPKDVDLKPSIERLATIDHLVRNIHIPRPTPQADLVPLTMKLQALEQRMAGLRMPDAPKPVDLSGVQSRLTAVEEAITRIRFPDIPDAKPVDFSAVFSRLDSLQARLDAPPAPAPAPLPALPGPIPAQAQHHVRAGSRNLLTKAAHGKPDDLQRIKGVAGVLETMMHGIGVYYFWQIAEWTPTDIEHVDEQLTAFKGRISRDHWVDQAQQFLREGGVAVKP
jgi:predicted flap endonuclease-1-like 5' DNA nuclease